MTVSIVDTASCSGVESSTRRHPSSPASRAACSDYQQEMISDMYQDRGADFDYDW